MEHLVAVAVHLDTGTVRYFITWGRIQDTVDPVPLEQLILAHRQRFGLDGRAVAARVCPTLQEAALQPLFHEALFSFSQQRIPFGWRYHAWRGRIDRRMRAGKEIYALGNSETVATAEHNARDS